MGRRYASKKWNERNERIFVNYDDTFLAVKRDGSVLHDGQELYEDSEYPFSTEGWKDIVALACDKSYLMGLKKDGTVEIQCCGIWDYWGVRDWKNIIDIDWGDGFAVGLTADGRVVKTGEKLEEINAWSDVVSVTACRHVVGLRSDGTVAATGNNEYGQCDVAGWSDIIAVAVSTDHTVGLKSDGTVVATGSNAYVEHRMKGISEEYRKAYKNSYGVEPFSEETKGGQCDVSEWADIVDIAVGCNFTIGLKADGTVVTAGDNIYGQLDVSDWRDIVSVSCTDSNTVGVRRDGSVVLAGRDLEKFEGCRDWRDIVLVRLGFQAIVGVKRDGTAVGALKWQSEPDITSIYSNGMVTDKIPERIEAYWKDIAVRTGK